MNESLLDELNEAIIVVDEALVVTRANLSARKMLGDVEGLALPDALHVQGISRIVDNFISGTNYSTDTIFVKDDTTHYLKIRVSAPYIIARNITSENSLKALRWTLSIRLSTSFLHRWLL